MKKKRNAKILGFLMLGLFGLILFSSIVNAQTSFQDSVKSWFNSVWEGWKAGGSVNTDIGNTFLKVLMAIIISLFVFSVLDVTSFIENTTASFVISVAVGLIGTYYMSAAEVQLLSNIYTAFGGTLITIIPFLVLGAFTIRAVERGNVQLMVLQHVAWGIFFAFLFYTAWTQSYLWESFNIIFYVILAATFFLTFWNWLALNWLAATLLRSKAVSSAENMQDIYAGINLFRRAGQQSEEPEPRQGVRKRRWQ